MKNLLMLTTALLLVGCETPLRSAQAQGIYMGRDGRAHAQVIVGPDGSAFPVAPTFCTPGFGPCPVVLGPPVGPYAPPPPPLPAPMALPPQEAAPAPQPLGIVYTRGTVCPEPRVCPIVWVSVAADGLNVREPNTGQPLMALVNGTPLAVLERRGQWTLVAPACALVPTGAWSITANVPLNRCWVY